MNSGLRVEEQRRKRHVWNQGVGGERRHRRKGVGRGTTSEEEGLRGVLSRKGDGLGKGHPGGGGVVDFQ